VRYVIYIYDISRLRINSARSDSAQCCYMQWNVRPVLFPASTRIKSVKIVKFNRRVATAVVLQQAGS
jgi:hypothetical protein